MGYFKLINLLYRWSEVRPGEWLGVFAGHVWRLNQTDTKLFFKVYGRKSETDAERLTPVVYQQLLFDYFRLSVNLKELYADWGARGNLTITYTIN